MIILDQNQFFTLIHRLNFHPVLSCRMRYAMVHARGTYGFPIQSIFPFGGILVLLVWELVNFDNNAVACYLKHKIKRRYDLQDTHETSKERFRVVGFHPSDGVVVLLSYMNYVYQHNLLTSRSKKIGWLPCLGDEISPGSSAGASFLANPTSDIPIAFSTSIARDISICDLYLTLDFLEVVLILFLFKIKFKLFLFCFFFF